LRLQVSIRIVTKDRGRFSAKRGLKAKACVEVPLVLNRVKKARTPHIRKIEHERFTRFISPEQREALSSAYKPAPIHSQRPLTMAVSTSSKASGAFMRAGVQDFAVAR